MVDGIEYGAAGHFWKFVQKAKKLRFCSPPLMMSPEQPKTRADRTTSKRQLTPADALSTTTCIVSGRIFVADWLGVASVVGCRFEVVVAWCRLSISALPECVFEGACVVIVEVSDVAVLLRDQRECKVALLYL